MKHNHNPNGGINEEMLESFFLIDQQLKDYSTKHNHNNGHKRLDVEEIFSFDLPSKN